MMAYEIEQCVLWVGLVREGVSCGMEHTLAQSGIGQSSRQRTGSHRALYKSYCNQNQSNILISAYY